MNITKIFNFLYIFLLTISVGLFAVVIFRFIRLYIELFNLILSQPESFFTNKILYLALLFSFLGIVVIYCFVSVFVNFVHKVYYLWKGLVSFKPCSYGGKSCEVGRKEHPQFYCSKHFIERLEKKKFIYRKVTK